MSMSGTYTTVQGDMWDAIAYKAMGSERYTGALMALNREHLARFTFPAGVVLALPEETVSAGASLPPWKKNAHT